MLLWIPSLSSPSIHYQTPPQMPSDLHVSTSSWFTPSNVVFHSPHLHWNWKKSLHKLKSLWQVVLLTAGITVWPAPSLPVFRIPPTRLSSPPPSLSLAADSFLLIRTPLRKSSAVTISALRIWPLCWGPAFYTFTFVFSWRSIVVSNVEKESWLFNFFLIFS